MGFWHASTLVLGQVQVGWRWRSCCQGSNNGIQKLLPFSLTILKTLEKFLKGTVAEDERQRVLSEGERKILASQRLSVLIKKKSINNVAVFSTASSRSGSQ